MMRTIAGAMLVLAGAAACGQPSPSTFGADFEASLCRWATRCNTFASERQCRDALAWESLGRFDYLTEAVADDRADFDPDAAGACLNHIEELGCGEETINRVVFDDGLRAAPAVCRDVYVGKVRNYDPCLASEECAGDDVVCGFPPPSTCMDACCVGSCRQLAGPPKLGEACTGACEDDAFCAVDPETSAFTVCTARHKLGEACSGFDDCAADLYCENDTGRCEARGRSGESCAARPCVEGLPCYSLDNASTCRSLPGEGEPCGEYNYPACARVDNYCDQDSLKCTRWPEPGKACANGGCMPYAQCEYSNGEQRCVALADLGAKCGEIVGPNGEYSWVTCVGHLQCGEAGKCVEPEAPQICELPE